MNGVMQALQHQIYWNWRRERKECATPRSAMKTVQHATAFSQSEQCEICMSNAKKWSDNVGWLQAYTDSEENERKENHVADNSPRYHIISNKTTINQEQLHSIKFWYWSEHTNDHKSENVLLEIFASALRWFFPPLVIACTCLVESLHSLWRTCWSTVASSGVSGWLTTMAAATTKPAVIFVLGGPGVGKVCILLL